MLEWQLPPKLRRGLLSEPFWWALPTVGAFLLNRLELRERRPAALPSSDWSRRERRALLANSEERRRNLEGKGPGLATVSAIIVAAVVIAITDGWSTSHVAARVILVAAATYAVFSLLTPIYLVGPQPRHVVDSPDLERAARAPSPDEYIAGRAVLAAMKNDLGNLRLANLLDAARRELSYSLVLLLIWIVFVPISGALEIDNTTRVPSTSNAPPAPRPLTTPRGQVRLSGSHCRQRGRDVSWGCPSPQSSRVASASHQSRLVVLLPL